MEVSAWILIGIIVGVTTKLTLRDYFQVSWIITIMLGITGAIVGGLISAIICIAIGNHLETNPIGSIISGAVGVLLLYQTSIK